MRRARFAVWAGMIAVAGLGLWAAQPGSSASERHARGIEARVAALEAAGPTKVQRVVQREVRTEVVPGAAVETPPDEAEVAVAEGRAFRSNAELAEAYAARFAAEPVDAAWAADAQRRYLPAIRGALPASSQLVSFECRSQFCDVSVVHDSIETSNGFILDLFAIDRHGPLAQDSAGFRAGEPQRTADGKLHYHLYIGRPGVQLAIDPPAAEPALRPQKST